MATFRGYNFENLSAPLWAEGYLNFGFVGVIAMMGILGYAIRRGDLALRQTLEIGGVALVLGAVLPFYMVIILRGSLLQAVDNVVVLAIAIWWISEPRRRT